MAAKKATKKAPAKKAGAKSLKEKRAIAADRRAKKAAFEAQYGEGHAALVSFWDAFEQYDAFKDPADLEQFHHHTVDVALAIRAYLTHAAGTLDEAFKVRRPDGYRQPTERKKFLKKAAVQREGKLLRYEHGVVVDDAFFELLAERHQVSATIAKQYYYAKHKGLKPKPEASPEGIHPEYRRRLNWKA